MAVVCIGVTKSAGEEARSALCLGLEPPGMKRWPRAGHSVNRIVPKQLNVIVQGRVVCGRGFQDTEQAAANAAGSKAAGQLSSLVGGSNMRGGRQGT